MSGGVVRKLCAVCAARLMADLLDTNLCLECIDAQQEKIVCDVCGKVKNCMTYAVRKREKPQ